MPAEDIKLDNAIKIGFASSERDGYTRWVELSAYFLNDPKFRKKQWICEVKARSVEPGEVDRRRVLRAGTLDRALKLIDDTELGRIVHEEAREWQEDNLDEIKRFYRAIVGERVTLNA